MKRYRDKMKTDTDKYEQKRRNETKGAWKSKNKKNDIAMLEEIRRQKKKMTKKIQSKTKSKKKQRKIRHLVHPIKEMNGKKSKQFKRKWDKKSCH